MFVQILMTDTASPNPEAALVHVASGEISGGAAERLRQSLKAVFLNYITSTELETIKTPEAAREFLRRSSLETCMAAILRGAEAIQKEAERKALALRVSRHLMDPHVAVQLGAAIDGTTKEVVWPDGERYPILASRDGSDLVSKEAAQAAFTAARRQIQGETSLSDPPLAPSPDDKSGATS